MIISDSYSRQKPNLAWLATLFLFLPFPAAAHDIPNDVTIQTYFKPSGKKLEVLMRVPLKAMRDMEFPAKAGGNIDIAATMPLLPGMARLWLSDFMVIYENGQPLPKRPTVAATQLSLEGDRSFESWEQAYAHMTGPPLPEATNVVWNQAIFDVLFEYPIQSDRARFSIGAMGLGRLGLRTLLIVRYVMPDGGIRAFQFDPPPELVRLDPAWYQAALTFVHLGFLHILEGTDHLLFLLCLVIPFRKFRSLIPVVTAFTVAHSTTLIASAYNLAPDALWFPPLIETLIAASIVYMALENIVGASSVHKRWVIAFGFGLVHGFGFSFALRETLQLAGAHMLTSLLSFNVGVELGQLLVLVVMIPVLDLLFKKVVAERMGTIILSALVAHTGWHWMLDRGDKLLQFHFTWPGFTPDVIVSLMRWTMAIVFLAALVWLASVMGRRTSTPIPRDARRSEAEAPTAASSR